MPKRKTQILRQILGDQAPEEALGRLEQHFEGKLLVVAGDVETIEAQAQELRLAITTAEAASVCNGSASIGKMGGRINGVGALVLAFGFAVFSGQEELLVTGGKDGLFGAGKFVGRSNVADGGVKADGVVMQNEVGD